MSSYYLLPKKINKSIEFEPHFSSKVVEPIISHSMMHYLHDMQQTIHQHMITNKDIEMMEHIKMVVNPYDFLCSKIPDLNISVNKLNIESPLFFIFIEIMSVFKLDFFGKNIICTYFSHIASHSKMIMDSVLFLRGDYNKDIHLSMPIHSFKEEYLFKTKSDFLFFELSQSQEHIYNIDKYVIEFITILYNILLNQAEMGCCVIKIGNICYKPILDILFIICGLYEKVYIIKPTASNIITPDRYIICKKYLHDTTVIHQYKTQLESILREQERQVDMHIHSLMKTPLPYYFTSKIEESCISIGHQTLEIFDQIMSLFKHKNNEDKLTNIKKSNIQKCVAWCLKYNIPCYKYL